MRRTVTVTLVEGRIFVLRGYLAHKLAIEAGLRPTYSGVHQGWMADTSRLSTFEAYCAHRHVPLDVEDLRASSRSEEQDPADALRGDNTESTDLPLFDLGGGR